MIACHQQGDSPEAIHRRFDVLPLNDIYAVIAYYLSHRSEMDVYLERRALEGERIRQEIEASYTPEQRAFNDRMKPLVNSISS